MSDNWHKEFEEARRELTAAEEEYRLADSAMARATSRMREAQRKCATLFRQRINQVNA